MRRKKRTGLATTIPGGLLRSSGVALLLTLLLSAILAKGLESGRISFRCSGYLVMGILFTVTFVESLTAMHCIKRRYLLISSAAGGIYFCMLLSATALFFGGQYEAVGETVVIVVAGCMTAFLAKSARNVLSHKQRKYG